MNKKFITEKDISINTSSEDDEATDITKFNEKLQK